MGNALKNKLTLSCFLQLLILYLYRRSEPEKAWHSPLSVRVQSAVTLMVISKFNLFKKNTLQIMRKNAFLNGNLLSSRIFSYFSHYSYLSNYHK